MLLQKSDREVRGQRSGESMRSTRLAVREKDAVLCLELFLLRITFTLHPLQASTSLIPLLLEAVDLFSFLTTRLTDCTAGAFPALFSVFKALPLAPS